MIDFDYSEECGMPQEFFGDMPDMPAGMRPAEECTAGAVPYGSAYSVQNCNDSDSGNGRLTEDIARMLQEEIRYTAGRMMSGIADMLSKTDGRISEAGAGMHDKLLRAVEQQEITIQKQHQSISRFQEDLLYKVQKPLIMDIIGIADNIRMMLQDQERERDYDALLDAVRTLEKWVEGTLSNNSVNIFRDTDLSASELNLKRQQVIDTEPTDDPAKHNTYVCERPGYTWSMPYLVVNSDVQLERILRENDRPQAFSYVIRPEEVVRLKYKKE